LKNPKVTVSVAEFKPFYIIGEVEHPGSFPYTSGLNVLSALAIAGGPTYRASKSTILIQHPGEPALKEYSMDAAVPILPGDIIKVPQRYFRPPRRRGRAAGRKPVLPLERRGAGGWLRFRPRECVILSLTSGIGCRHGCHDSYPR
jgi:protein involved in polysaccharide export with SLBB domain